ncbi:MAG TPA: thymidylate synthase, partial [Paraburkholderia sp.]
MKQYLDLVRSILDTGSWQENRTGIRTISQPGAMLRFDLQQGFPAVTTKKLAFKSAVGELIGFLRASSSAADFRALGCKVWDANANENAQWLANPYREGTDDLGDVYGVQWRRWPAYKVLDADATAQVDDARSRGYEIVTAFAEDGRQKVLLYKAIDQLRQCLDTIMSNPSDRRILFHG